MGRYRVILGSASGLITGEMGDLFRSDFDLLGVAQRQEIKSATLRLKPDIILFDAGIPMEAVIEAVFDVATMSLPPILLCKTVWRDSRHMAIAVRPGESACKLHWRVDTKLDRAVHGAILAAFDPEDVPSNSSDPCDPQLHRKLTVRQERVLHLVAEGHSDKEIAACLGISTKTVAFHKAQIRQKLNIHTLAGLIKYALRFGLIDPRV